MELLKSSLAATSLKGTNKKSKWTNSVLDCWILREIVSYLLFKVLHANEKQSLADLRMNRQMIWKEHAFKQTTWIIALAWNFQMP